MAKRFTFHEEWKEAIMALPDDIRLEVYDAIVGFAFGDSIEGLKPMAGVVLNFIKPVIDEELRHQKYIAERNRRNGMKHIGKINNDQSNPIEPNRTQSNPLGFLASQEERTEEKERTKEKEEKKEDVLTDGCKKTSFLTFTRTREDLFGEPLNEPRPQKKQKVNVPTIRARDEIFIPKYKSLYDTMPYLAAVEMTHLRQVLLKLRNQRIDKGLPNDDDSLLNAFRVFLDEINKEWIFDNYSPQMINSKFNEIISQIKNKRRYEVHHDPKRGCAAPDPAFADEYYGTADDSF